MLQHAAESNDDHRGRPPGFPYPQAFDLVRYPRAVLSSLIGNVFGGYGLAQRAWLRILAVQLPVLAVALFVMTGLDLVLAADRTVMLNGLPMIEGEAAWWRLLVIPVCWLLGLSAGAIAAVGVARREAGAETGGRVPPVRALRAAIRTLPLVASGLVVVGGITFGAVYLAGSLGAGWFSLALVIAVLVIGGLEAVRMLLTVLTGTFGGSPWALTRGRITGTAGAFLLGGIVLPALPVNYLLTLSPQQLFTNVLVVVWVILTGSAQAGLLAHVYLLPRADVSDPTQPPADLAAVDAHLTRLTGTASRPVLWAGVLAAVLALLAPAGVALANPYGAPTVRAHDDMDSGVNAVVWPAGKHPTVATWTGARFCENDACDERIDVNGGPGGYDGNGAAGISADGDTVVNAMVTGGPDNGGPFINYARCTRTGCPEAWVPVRKSAKEKLAEWPELGAAVGPDQSLWFVLAFPQGKTFRIVFVRCGEVGCKKPQRYEAGTVTRLVPEPQEPSTVGRVQLTVGADGLPLATVWGGNTLASIRCERPDCATTRRGEAFVGVGVAAWTAPTVPGGPAVSLEDGGRLRVGDQMLSLSGVTTAPRTGAIAAGHGVHYATRAERATAPGFRITVGGADTSGTETEEAEPVDHWQQVLWRCEQLTCTRRTLDRVDYLNGHEVMAVSEDGRVFIARPSGVLLVSE
jgi:hypothetical protein